MLGPWGEMTLHLVLCSLLSMVLQEFFEAFAIEEIVMASKTHHLDDVQ